VLVVCTAAEPWPDISRLYAQTFDRLNGLHKEPPPTGSTSRCYSARGTAMRNHIDQQGVLKIARKCKELGFGTILIDALGLPARRWLMGTSRTASLETNVAAPDRFPTFQAPSVESTKWGCDSSCGVLRFWQGKKSRAIRRGPRLATCAHETVKNSTSCAPGIPAFRKTSGNVLAWIAEDIRGANGKCGSTRADGVFI